MLGILLILATAAGGHDRSVPIEIAAGDRALAGHGPSKRVEHEVDFDGLVHAWAVAAEPIELFLRIEDADGKLLAQDDGAGGKRTPFAKLEVQPGTKLVIVVAAAKPGDACKAELHLAASIETEATRAEVESAAKEIAAIRKLREARSLDAARKRAEDLAEHLHKVDGVDDSELLNRCGWDLAQETKALGLVRPTEKLLHRALEHRVHTAPDDHPGLQMVRQNYAFVLRDLGDLHGARDLQEKVLAIRERTLSPDDLDLQAARDNLAVTVQALGDNGRARTLLEVALEVESRTLPAGHASRLSTQQNLGLTLGSLGDLSGARVLFERVLEADQAALQDDAFELQGARGNVALVTKQLGDYAGARAIEEKVLEVYSSTLPDDHPRLQSARLNLAGTLMALGELESARGLLEKVLDVRTATLPDAHPELQVARQNLATSKKLLGDLKGARVLEEKVLEVAEKTLPDDHPDLQKARQNLGITLDALGEIDAARALFERVLAIRSVTLPDDHPSLQLTRSALAMLLAEHGGKGKDATAAAAERDRMTSMARDFARSLTRSAELAILTVSGREAEERCARLSMGLGLVIALSRGLGSYPPDPELRLEAFRLSETTRDAAQASAGLARAAHGDERYAALHEHLRKAVLEIARLAQSGAKVDEFRTAIARRDEARRELVQLAGAPGAGSAALGGISEFDVDALAARLAPREALVAYREHSHYAPEANEPGPSVKPHLSAFVLRPARGRSAESKSADGPATFTLELVDLGPTKEIGRAVSEWRELLGAPLDRGLAAATPGEHEDRARAAGEVLRRLVVDPLLPALADVDHVVLTLDDVLHAVPIDALPLEHAATDAPGAPLTRGTNGASPASAPKGSGDVHAAAPELLGEKFAIEERLSLRELLRDERPVHGPESLVALGGASFNSQPLGPTAEETAALDAEPEQATAVASLLRGGAWERGFTPLTYTGLEAREVGALFEEAFGDKAPAVVLEKRRASRDSATELAPKARWLHLATHGWFAPQSVRSFADPDPIDRLSGLAPGMDAEQQVRGASPMILCGLALAGANLPADAVGRYPGLVTAEEIASWDLSNCELSVLSACDTNVGERRAGQGVASLQRALHMAGARSAITSLWKVPDEATKELMLEFYRRVWVEKKPKSRALWEAKMKLRDALDENGKPKYSTRDWAGWVLTGDPN